MLSLHILQAALVYVNILMVHDILAEPEWAGVLTPEDLRGLTLLFWAHVLPYGEVKLNNHQTPCPHHRPDRRRDQRRVELSGRQVRSTGESRAYLSLGAALGTQMLQRGPRLCHSSARASIGTNA